MFVDDNTHYSQVYIPSPTTTQSIFRGSVSRAAPL
jgi:hypothetical protein